MIASGQLVGHCEPLTRQIGQFSFVIEPDELDEVELIKPDDELLLELDRLPDEEEELKVALKVQILSGVLDKPGKADATREDCPEIR